ncbi:hypothetical protein PF003_g5890 [Phytophthora fragariae]|nr:hypothetical protein PF003_g5890 [Phytophthora fragariae]
MEEGVNAVVVDEQMGAEVLESDSGPQPPVEDTSSHAPRRAERTTCYFKGYKYTRAWASSRKIVYRCSKFRAGCGGTMEFRIASMGYTCVKAHSCSATAVVSSVTNVEAEMKAQADLLAIEHVAWPVRRVWEELQRRFYSTDNPDVVRGLSEQQVTGRVHHARRQHYSGNVHGSIEIPPLALALDEAVTFFQFHCITPHRDDLTKPTRLLGWAHPALVALLRYHGTTLFVDGTFRCVPSGYAQCVVFMVHDRASGVFVPVFYVLSTSRTADSYWDMIHFIVQATDQQIEPAEIVCDFEAALMDSLQTQFPNAIVLGCLFHMKQALRRAMKRYAIPEEECLIAMTHGVLDTLTVIQHDHIERGIKLVKREIKRRCVVADVTYSAAKWGEFWGYFERTWLEQYSIEVWNVFGLDNELIARTNNPLDRFNRELNSRFPTPHPSMATFVTVIKTISQEYVRRVANVPRGRARRVAREVIQLSEVVDISADITSDVETTEAVAPSDNSTASVSVAL